MRSPESIYSAPAAADYSATLYRFATVDTSGNIATVGSAGAHAVGILSNQPASGEQARIEWDGVHKIEVGTGGLTPGQTVSSDATGKGVHDTTSGHSYMGLSLGTYAAGDVGIMLWSPGTV